MIKFIISICIITFAFFVILFLTKKNEKFQNIELSKDISLESLRNSFKNYAFDIPAYTYGIDEDPLNLPEKINGNLYKNSDINEFNDLYKRVESNTSLIPNCFDCMKSNVRNPDTSPNSTCGKCIYN